MTVAHTNISFIDRTSQWEKTNVWMHEHPTITKILKVAGLILGLGLLLTLPFALPILTAGETVAVALTGIVLTAASLALRRSISPKQITGPAFQHIDSSLLERIAGEKNISHRNDFFGLAQNFPPPLIGKSEFVSKEMVEHLMRHKKDSALGIKYVEGDQITNMEGALHTFVTPVCKVLMTGDFQWKGYLEGKTFGNNQVRPIILSAAIHPDLQLDTVVMPLIRAREQAITGAPLDRNEIPSPVAKKNSRVRAAYEEKLLKHMIYHLSPTHRLPALHEIPQDQIMTPLQAQNYLEKLIQNPQKSSLQGKFLRVGESILSLEILLQIYMQQLRNEFKVLNANTPQGYVYTIHPPAIFSRAIGGATILNRLQALAFQSLLPENLFSHLKVLGFSDYADKGMVPLLQKVLPSVQVVSQNTLFEKEGTYQGPPGLALVLHNNSDGFGQNIETEGATSLDGVIGSYSNAASVLKRERPDLVDFVF